MAWGMAAAASQRAQAAAERAAKAEVKAQASHADVLKAGAAAASILRVTQNSIKSSEAAQQMLKYLSPPVMPSAPPRL